MKIALVNRSDSTGGAAVVTYRLMQALRAEGVDARMLVLEKLTDDPNVISCSRPLIDRYNFLSERWNIFLRNGFSRANLFKVDIANHRTGLEALKAIRAKDSNANIVMCSAMGKEAMVVEAVQAGIKDFIVKPFKEDRLMKTVTSILGAP